MVFLYVILGLLCAISGVAVLHALFFVTVAAFVKVKDYDKASRFYRSVFIYYLKLILFFSRIKVTTSGMEKLAGIKGGFLLVGNHRSDFDPIITLVALRNKNFAFISKPENFKIPVVRKFLYKGLYAPIDRENARNALKTVNLTAARIKGGVISYGVYPEGTRSKGKNLLPFHDGVFKIAQKAEAPIVVAGVTGTETVHKRAPWRRTVVHFDILDIIDTEKVKALSSHGLAGIAHEKLLSATEGK
ncbi:MAG: 1-acyl-sn-glycerol-3-phosphate acyltransferase [Clostridia bacterium]|nr:1-acyl-sn-glycerol-3-phosphate acyltransferase [Clostridia bacterium]